jgi:exonuclease III
MLLLFLSSMLATASSFRIVQYNTEWLFMNPYKTASGYCPGEGCTWKTVDDATVHMNCVADVLTTLNADIVHLCEIEGLSELELLKQTGYESYLVPSTDSATGQNVALLSRIAPSKQPYRIDTKVVYPVAGTNCQAGVSGMEGVSKHIITEFNFTGFFNTPSTDGGFAIALIGAHLLAQPYDVERCVKREAQATVLRNIMDDYLAKGYEVILLGDLNDFDDMDTVNPPISQVLAILKGDTMFNLADWLDEKEKYSNWWDSDGNCSTSSSKDYSMIDHILVSDGLLGLVEDVSIYHGYDIYCGKWDSDHYPVIVDFDLP